MHPKLRAGVSLVQTHVNADHCLLLMRCHLSDRRGKDQQDSSTAANGLPQAGKMANLADAERARGKTTPV